jgi:hypothetical protein
LLCQSVERKILNYSTKLEFKTKKIVIVHFVAASPSCATSLLKILKEVSHVYIFHHVCVFSYTYICKVMNQEPGQLSDRALGYGLDEGGSSPGRGWEFFSSPPRSDRIWSPPSLLSIPGALSLGVKRPGREADYSPPSNAEVKNTWSYTSTPTVGVHGVELSLKHRENFT